MRLSAIASCLRRASALVAAAWSMLHLLVGGFEVDRDVLLLGFDARQLGEQIVLEVLRLLQLCGQRLDLRQPIRRGGRRGAALGQQFHQPALLADELGVGHPQRLDTA